jgi:hypothetical protein
MPAFGRERDVTDQGDWVLAARGPNGVS